MNENISQIQTAINVIELALENLQKNDGLKSHSLWRSIGEKDGNNPKPTKEIIEQLEAELRCDQFRNAALATLDF